jgi:outer membrane receptor for ferrienterochelin and colicin
MKYFASSLVAITAVLGNSAIAQAQDAPPVEQLPEAVAEGDRVEGAYDIGTGVDSGTSTIESEEIEARTPGSGDVNQLLKILPTVQFTRDEGLASPDDILDLRPADISISGGRIYDNLLMLDGVDVGSRLDVTNSNPYDSDETAGNAAQNIWLDSNLIGAVTLRDSNVSAEFGSFTGGVLNIETRAPMREWGVSGYVNYTSDATTKFNVSKGTRAAYEDSGEELPAVPDFSKWRFGATLDMPVSDDVALLFAASRQVAHVTNFRSSSYGSGSYDENSESNNFLVSALVDLPDDMTLKAKGTYSPYRVDTSRYNAYGLDVLTKGGGYTGALELSKAGIINWEAKLNYVHADSGRESGAISYVIPSDLCSSSSCSIGGNGDLNQTQDSFVASFKASTDLGPGTLRGGLEFEHVDAHKDQPDDRYTFSRPFTQQDAVDDYGIAGSIICDVADPMACVEGEYASNWIYYRPAFDVDVSLDSASAWAEYDVTLGAFDIRSGIRYDYESFLGNHDFSPRLAVNWNLPGEGNWQISAGANRYFGKSMLAYAIREAQPNYFIYAHNPTVVGDDLLFSDDDLSTYREYIVSNYNSAELSTPYSDELTAALTGEILGGTVRLKGIMRWGKDEFARSARERVTGDTSIGTYTYNYYEITNEGSSTYKGVSLEWVREINENHSVALNVNYSETDTSNANYIEVTDDTEAEDTLVLYNGEIRAEAEIYDLNRRLDYAAPLIVNATWNARWFSGRLRTNLNFRYRNGFNQIEDSLVNETIDGTRYDVFTDVRYRDNFDFNLNAELDFARTRYGTLTGDMRVSNILNRIASKEHVSTTYPWQYGRQFWIGLKFKY